MLHVRNVRGRYPRRGILRSENLVTSVQEIARVFRIRIDDEENPEAWIELTVEADFNEENPQEVNGEISIAG